MEVCMREYIRQYLNSYVDKFKTLGLEDVESLILFGSQAKGTATISSDVDIAVVMKKPLDAASRGNLRCLGEYINPNIVTNLYFTTTEALENPQHHFDTNTYIKKEGIVLWQG